VTVPLSSTAQTLRAYVDPPARIPRSGQEGERFGQGHVIGVEKLNILIPQNRCPSTWQLCSVGPGGWYAVHWHAEWRSMG
jgi:hypothetical protein